MRTLEIALVAILALPIVAAQPQIDIEIIGGDPLSAMLAPTGEDQFVNLTVRARIENESMYVKAVPTPWHPAVANGTVDSDGWWTEVWVTDQNDSWYRVGATNGSGPVYLEDLPDRDQHLVTLRIRVPAAAQVEGAQYRLSYALAVPGARGGQSAGGVLDPSVPLLAILTVPVRSLVTPVDPEGSAPEEPARRSPNLPIIILFGVMSLVLVAAGIATVLMLRRRNGTQ